MFFVEDFLHIAYFNIFLRITQVCFIYRAKGIYKRYVGNNIVSFLSKSLLITAKIGANALGGK